MQFLAAVYNLHNCTGREYEVQWKHMS